MTLKTEKTTTTFLLIALAAITTLFANNAYATEPFTQCPAIGVDTSCAILIVFNADGTVSILEDVTQGTYDEDDDTLIGVQNNFGSAIPKITLSGSNIFGFDEDGICSGEFFGTPADCPFGTTGYEGPETSFTIVDDNSGDVNFIGGLAPGASTYFSLEEAILATDLEICGNGIDDNGNDQIDENCPPIRRNHGGLSFDVTSPTINGINFFSVQGGTQTEGFGGRLAGYYNDIPTQIMNTGEEQRLQISVSDNNGIVAIKRVVVNMFFDYDLIQKGDTYFMYSEKDGLTVSDPSGFFGDVKVNRTFTDTEMILTFIFTPQKPMPITDLAVNGLDEYGNNQNTNIPHAFVIQGEPVVNPGTNNLIVPESSEMFIPYYKLPYYEIPDADSEGNLIYYNSFGGLEQNQVHPHYDPIIYPDEIGRAERHDDGFYGKVAAEEDKAKEVASAIMVHPIYSGEQKIFKTDKVFKYPSTVGKADRSHVDAMKELMHKENVKAMHISKRVS